MTINHSAPTPPVLVPAQDLAAEIGVSTATLVRWSRDGRVPRPIGRFWHRARVLEALAGPAPR